MIKDVIIDGMTLVMRGNRSPEQYEVISKDGKMLAYMKVRGGRFHVECPDVGGTLIYDVNTNGKGCFIGDERIIHLTEAVKKVKLFYKQDEQKVGKNLWFCAEDSWTERERLVAECQKKEEICRTQQRKGRWTEKRDQTVTFFSGFEFDTREDKEAYEESCRQYFDATKNLQECVDKEKKELEQSRNSPYL